MKLPEGVKASLDGHKVTISGPKGAISMSFSRPDVKMEMKGGELEVTGSKEMATTIESHVRNMALGVTQGYSKKLKILFSHFPISVEVKGKEILIKNFMGEKQPRKSSIRGQTKVESKGQELSISGISKDDVGQTFANLKSATKIRNRDSRVFQDGFYEIES
ncbi:TPA: 50S ribosomal protein L6 [Candidatus Micrarchaeota archaeon]|nr:50S ribosomal protein L6P [uncultured archaeon]HIH18504.1 50S ribosomal protein L6 [Candidatus Micrarchaeota archaeon]HIH29821.1 50S ribosomal protein L6 [Candidatus Micrarchaeota archaeon]